MTFKKKLILLKEKLIKLNEKFGLPLISWILLNYFLHILHFFRIIKSTEQLGLFTVIISVSYGVNKYFKNKINIIELIELFVISFFPLCTIYSTDMTTNNILLITLIVFLFLNLFISYIYAN